MQTGFAGQADLDAMADLLGELFALETDFTPDRARQRAALRWILDHPDHGRLFVLRDGDAVVGMANALIQVSTAEGGPVLVLEDVIVAASHRGRGQGRRLVEHVLAWARDTGLSRVTLLADRDNAAALRFYQALGFEESAMVVRRRMLA
ncbi:MAG: GNAT family N-acetyltransferase [Rhodocyclales bacterium]|nr:GNAT family N-acetyltransferase [Rhodocyclales bacterium]